VTFVVEEAPGNARDLFAGLRDYGDGHLAETKLTARVDYIICSCMFEILYFFFLIRGVQDGCLNPASHLPGLH
jgi:hypothetical protein